MSIHSHILRSWGWVALFVRRSQSRLLDISVDLESYAYQPEGVCVYRKRQHPDPPHIRMGTALAIVGPHVGRWRAIAVRGWAAQLNEFFNFLPGVLGAASRVESAQFSVVDSWYIYHDDFPALHELPSLVGIHDLRSLRVNAAWCHSASRRIPAVQSLDIDLSGLLDFDPRYLREVFGPGSTLRTLVIRKPFSPVSPSMPTPYGCLLSASARSFTATDTARVPSHRGRPRNHHRRLHYAESRASRDHWRIYWCMSRTSASAYRQTGRLLSFPTCAPCVSRTSASAARASRSSSPSAA
ncbi:hypothetical protein DFH09DRAFT_1121295 [Mycena vulgaris]|nr:hypothetical protein DFH09DRAFT_1121295 [Mycena vulgaris]